MTRDTTRTEVAIIGRHRPEPSTWVFQKKMRPWNWPTPGIDTMSRDVKSAITTDQGRAESRQQKRRSRSAHGPSRLEAGSNRCIRNWMVGRVDDPESPILRTDHKLDPSIVPSSLTIQPEAEILRSNADPGARPGWTPSNAPLPDPTCKRDVVTTPADGIVDRHAVGQRQRPLLGRVLYLVIIRRIHVQTS